MQLSQTLTALASYSSYAEFIRTLSEGLVPLRVANFYWVHLSDVCKGTYSGRHYAQRSGGGLTCYTCRSEVSA